MFSIAVIVYLKRKMKTELKNHSCHTLALSLGTNKIKKALVLKDIFSETTKFGILAQF